MTVLVSAAIVVLTSGPASACSCGGTGTDRGVEFDGTANRILAGERDVIAVWEFTDIAHIYGSVPDPVELSVSVGTPHVTDPGTLAGGCGLIERVVPGARYRVIAVGEPDQLGVGLCAGAMTVLASPSGVAGADGESLVPRWWPAPALIAALAVGVAVGKRRPIRNQARSGRRSPA